MSVESMQIGDTDGRTWFAISDPARRDAVIVCRVGDIVEVRP